MADLQISALPALGEAGIQATDVLALADLSATETKKVTVKDLVAAAVALLDSGDIPAAKVATPFATDAVATATIQNLAVTAAKIANSTITATQIANTTITGAKLVNDTVTATQIAANAITASELADDAVDTAAIADLAVDNARIANTTIAYAKLDLSDGDIPGAKIASGGITATQLATNSVTATELADNAVDANAIASGVITGAKIASNTIAAGNIVNNTITATQIANGAIGNAQIAAGAIDASKLSGALAATSIADDAVSTQKIQDDAVDSSKLAANAVDAAALADNSVDAGAIASNAVIEAKIAANAVTNAKIADGTITAAKLNTSNVDRSLNVASGNLGINNTVTAATRSGITYNAQGLITGTVALAAGDLPVATTSAVGGVSISTGLTVSGAGALSLSNSVTAATMSGITYNAQGQITATTALTASDLPVATTSAKGAVQITSGGGLTVSGTGELITSTSGISAGTFTKLTVNNKGVATAGAALASSDIPDLSAAKLTSGTLDAARIGADTIDSSKLSNSSTTIIQSITQLGYPTAAFTGQLLFDPIAEDAYLWDGNAWNPITTLTKGALVRLGTYNANLSQVDYVTAAGSAAGLTVGQNLPVASDSVDGGYVVISVQGTPSGVAGITGQLSPPDYLLGVTASASSSSWVEIDLSTTVASQQASAISYTPHGQLSSTNVQAALNEIEDEKLAKAGGTVTGELLIGNAGSLVFEGSTVDAFETKLTVADPTTSDKTITLPNVTGTVITTGDTGTVNSTMLLDGTILNADINANADIALSKLADITSAQIIVGNGSNVPTAVAVTGDISINNAGLTAITAGAIVNADISGSAAITGSKVTTGTTSAVGVLQLTDSTSSTSATTAGTPAAIKTAFDLATTANTTAGNALAKAGGTMTGNLILDNAKEIRFSEADSNGANYLGLKAPDSVTADITWILPATDSTGTQFLKSDGSGNLGWASDSTVDNTKLPLAGGTMSGDINLGTNDITNGGTITGTFVGNITGNLTGTADEFTVTANNSTDETVYPLFADGATGSQGAETDTGLTYNPSTGLLTAGEFVGNLTGNATTASTGTAVNVTANESSDELLYLAMVDGTSGAQGIEADSSLQYNPSTGLITTTGFVGNLTGNASGTAATVTGAAQSAITSVGTLTGLTVSGNILMSGNGAIDVAAGTDAQRPGSPNAGMFRFNTDDNKFEGYDGSAWGEIGGGGGGGATGGGTDTIFVENSLVVTTNYTIGNNGTTNKSASSVGPITINATKTVNVPTGHRWVII
jgi:hypothetical protein